MWHKARFIFRTPFTKEGRRAQADDVTQQCMRVTTLTVDRAFPYMKTRLPVCKKEEVELTPIENAILGIKQRAAVIESECDSEFVSVKTLQPLLQGSLLVSTLRVHPCLVQCHLVLTHLRSLSLSLSLSLSRGSHEIVVNEGPVKMCRPFFEQRVQYPPENVTALGEALRAFLRACKRALGKHEMIMGPEYLELQEQLLQGYQDLEITLNNFIEGRV